MAIWYVIVKIEGKDTLVERSQNCTIGWEEPNLREFDGEVGEDETGAASPFDNGGYFLLRKSTMATYTNSGYAYILNLILVEVGQSVCNYPW